MSQTIQRAVTIPEAALVLPFNVTTLRKYVQAWEAAYGALPIDPNGYKHLVGPLVEIFDDAYRLMTQSQPIAVRLDAAVAAKTERIPEIIAAYRRCPNGQMLAGIEEMATRLTIELIRHVRAHLARLDEVHRSASDVRQQAGVLRNDIMANIASWVDDQRDDAHRLSETVKRSGVRINEVAGAFSRTAERSTT